MKGIDELLDEDRINNIFNQYSNVFVINYSEDAKIDKDYAGRLVLKVNMKKDKKYIRINDHVRFRRDKVKWKSVEQHVCIVDPYWVKPFINDEKLQVQVKVLKSKVVGNIREYYIDYETVELNYKQFITRRLFEEFGELKHSYLEAYSNFQDRRKQVGYYQALNETSKHYLIKHEDLKKLVIPRVNNAIKRFKKEWDDLYVQDAKNAKAKTAIDQLMKDNASKPSKVIPISRINPD